MILTARFFAAIRQNLFQGHLSQAQVTNMETLIKAAVALGLPVQQLAYVLATCYHETGRTMEPVREIGRGKGYDYGKQLDMGKGPGQRVPYTDPKHVFYGRGYVQLTWLSNYRAAGQKLGFDLVNNPDLALEPAISGLILVRGMAEGWFTGRRLSQYFTTTGADPVNARKIVNGTDKAGLIAEHYQRFLFALTC